uniref:Phospholipase-like protein n=1 Tax=Tanacetum cinerariifolium TaxID=118510 RepID=A0A6L2KYZ2_TANCI|nr:phospholipase-like protein [Tanacetum cinerariifolium]
MDDDHYDMPLVYNVEGRFLHLGRPEFSLITGLHFGSFCFRKFKSGDVTFVSRVLPHKLGLKVTNLDLLGLIEYEELFDKLVDDDVVRVCLLLAFDVIFIGKKLVDEVPDTLMHLVETLRSGMTSDRWKRTPKSYQRDWLGQGSNCLKDLIIVYYLARCDTTIVEEIRLKDGVIAKLKSRVFKLEAIIKVLGNKRAYLCSGCWEELNEKFNELCETRKFLNGPAMIDLDPDDDLVQMLKYDEDKKKRRHELMNSDHWKHFVLKITNGKRTQRSSAFSAYFLGTTFAMAETDRPLNSLNDQDMNIFLKDVTPWVEDLSRYNQATYRVHLSNAFDIFLGRQGPLRCRFSWCKDSCGSITCGMLDPTMLIGPWLVVTLSSFSFKTRSRRGMLMARCTKSLGAMLKRMIVSVPTPYSTRLLGFNSDEEPIIEVDDIGYQMDTTLQVYHRTHKEFQNLGVEANFGSFFVGAFRKLLILSNETNRSYHPVVVA